MEDKNKNEGQNKRQFNRLESTYMVSYRQENDISFDMSLLKDISKGGMSITTGNKQFDAGDHLVIKVRVPFAPERREEVLGEVVASSRGKDGVFVTRVKFLQINQEFAQELGEFVERRYDE